MDVKELLFYFSGVKTIRDLDDQFLIYFKELEKQSEEGETNIEEYIKTNIKHTPNLCEIFYITERFGYIDVIIEHCNKKNDLMLCLEFLEEKNEYDYDENIEDILKKLKKKTMDGD